MENRVFVRNRLSIQGVIFATRSLTYVLLTHYMQRSRPCTIRRMTNTEIQLPFFRRKFFSIYFARRAHCYYVISNRVGNRRYRTYRFFSSAISEKNIKQLPNFNIKYQVRNNFTRRKRKSSQRIDESSSF